MSSFTPSDFVRPDEVAPPRSETMPQQLKEESPPAYTKLGEEARKLFSTGFVHNVLVFTSRAEIKEMDDTGQRFTLKAGAVQSLANNRLKGSLSAKYHFPRYGIVLTEKWDTTNKLSSTIAIKNKFAENVRAAVHSEFRPLPEGYAHEGSVKCEVAGNHYKVNISMFPAGEPLFVIGGVLSLNSWYAGARGKMRLLGDAITGGAEACVGRRTPFYNFHSFFEADSVYGMSLHLKPHDNIELGSRMSWDSSDDRMKFGLVMKSRLNDKMTLLGKVDEGSTVGMSVITELSEETRLTLSVQCNPGSASSSIGALLSFSPK